MLWKRGRVPPTAYRDVVPGDMLCGVTDLVAKLLSAAAAARTIKAFWQSAAHTFSERWGGARVRLSYAGLREAGTVLAGHGTTGPPRESEWVDPQGRRVQLAVETDPDLPLPGLAEIACRLGAMVALRLGLERDRRLGTFLMELSRWLLAAPERDLMLRYTMQSVMNLVEAQGAYVALREPAGGAGEGSTLRVVTAIGTGVEMHGLELPLEASVTGRVVRTGQPVNTENILAEPDSYTPADLSRTARAAMIVPLNTSSGVAGAAGVIRYMQLGAQEPPPPRLVQLLYPADAVDQGQGQWAPVHHRGGARRGLPRGGHGLGELEAAGDVCGDGGEVVQLHEPERRRRLLRAELHVSDDARSAGDAARGIERHDHGRASGAGQVGRGIAVGLGEDVLGVDGLAGAHDPTGDAGLERQLQAVHLHAGADGRHHAQRAALSCSSRRLAQRHVGALGLDQVHHALHRVA